jgi:hypothetical protein
MGTTTPLQAEVERYGRNLDEIAQAAGLPGSLARIYGSYPGLVWRNRALLKKVRWFMASCHEACPEAACVGGLYPGLAAIRNNLLALRQKAGQTVLLAPLRRSLERLAADWDDLVEDCALAQDQDVRRLIFKIADAL